MNRIASVTVHTVRIKSTPSWLAVSRNLNQGRQLRRGMLRIA
ncbi:MAG: hypothetical protein ACI92S_001390, partial [Planctomycetaceae bacterium]